MKLKLEGWLNDAVKALKAQKIIAQDTQINVSVTYTKDKSHGDFASNIALILAKSAQKAPRDVAQLILNLLGSQAQIDKMEIAGPGFINFFLSQAAASQVIVDVLRQGKAFGKSDCGQQQKVGVEFVSANPTGPLHIGHGRGAVVGDCIARLLKATGWDVTREFYYNDAGQQINNLACSVQARAKGLTPADPDWRDDWYQGEYIKDVAADYINGASVSAADKQVTALGDIDNQEAIKEFAVAYLRREQDLDLKAFDVDFDIYFLESSLYTGGDVEKTVTSLIDKGHTYDKDGALWLKTTEYGDDKDRVMRKSDGGYTYFVPDIAYHANKWERGFARVVNEFGADHHSTVDRVRAGLQALNIGIPKGWPEVVLHQMVTVMRGDEEVKISKRAGSYVTLRDIIEEVGCDATRFFLAARRSTSQMTFDLALAKSKTNENPVYYIQYAHARICSALRKLEALGQVYQPALGQQNLSRLNLTQELALMDRMNQYPDLVANAAKTLEPHVIAHYLRDLAADLHAYYQAGAESAEHRWIVDDPMVCQARMGLISAVKQVIANGLDLLAVNAPEKM